MIDSVSSSSNLLLQPQDDNSDDDNSMNLGGILSQVVGEVEKLIEDVLQQAQASNGSSSSVDDTNTDAQCDDGSDDVNDSQNTFPNIDVSSLLQQLEANFRAAQSANNQTIQV